MTINDGRRETGDCILHPVTIDAIKHRATIQVPEAAELLGVSRSQGYAAARAGEIPTLKLGHRIVVPVKPLLALLGEEVVNVDE